MTPPDPMLEALERTHSTASEMRGAARELVELTERQDRPARLTTVVLTEEKPVWPSEGSVERPSKAIGVLNPTDVVVLLGTEGSPTADARAVPVPPQSLLVLPIGVDHVEIGTDADLSTGDVVCYLLRFETAQPAFLGSA